LSYDLKTPIDKILKDVLGKSKTLEALERLPFKP